MSLQRKPTLVIKFFNAGVPDPHTQWCLLKGCWDPARHDRTTMRWIVRGAPIRILHLIMQVTDTDSLGDILMAHPSESS